MDVDRGDLLALEKLGKILGQEIPRRNTIQASTLGYVVVGGRVVGLGLHNAPLEGVPECIADLTALQTLNLRGTQIHTVPQFLQTDAKAHPRGEVSRVKNTLLVAILQQLTRRTLYVLDTIKRTNPPMEVFLEIIQQEKRKRRFVLNQLKQDSWFLRKLTECARECQGDETAFRNLFNPLLCRAGIRCKGLVGALLESQPPLEFAMKYLEEVRNVHFDVKHRHRFRYWSRSEEYALYMGPLLFDRMQNDPRFFKMVTEYLQGEETEKSIHFDAILTFLTHYTPSKQLVDVLVELNPPIRFYLDLNPTLFTRVQNNPNFLNCLNGVIRDSKDDLPGLLHALAPLLRKATRKGMKMFSQILVLNPPFQFYMELGGNVFPCIQNKFPFLTRLKEAVELTGHNTPRLYALLGELLPMIGPGNRKIMGVMTKFQFPMKMLVSLFNQTGSAQRRHPGDFENVWNYWKRDWWFLGQLAEYGKDHAEDPAFQDAMKLMATHINARGNDLFLDLLFDLRVDLQSAIASGLKAGDAWHYRRALTILGENQRWCQLFCTNEEYRQILLEHTKIWQLRQVLDACFSVNVAAANTESGHYSGRFRWYRDEAGAARKKRLYARKNALLQQAIALTLQVKAPFIKWGYKMSTADDWSSYPVIIYFQFGEYQVSFHSKITTPMPRFKGSWIGEVNIIFPITEGVLQTLLAQHPDYDPWKPVFYAADELRQNIQQKIRDGDAWNEYVQEEIYFEKFSEDY